MKAKKFFYHIIITSQGKQIKDIYRCSTEKKAREKFQSLIDDNSKVVFPVKYINNGGLKDANYEIVIIKSRENKETKTTKIRNIFGKYINYETSSDDWIVLDRQQYFREETFWVYGYHPQLQRKTFQWIYENIIENNNNSDYFKNVFLFKNKFICDTNGQLDIVFCKNINDAIRLYNELQEKARSNKLKYIIWSGDMSLSKMKMQIMERLMKWTGWSYNKIRRNSLRP